ncbi:putative Cytochrome P450 [Pseudorhizobium banfieldiae]|uniref:Putative Cytochrome P450 n=1 Tax=Pseudorhizobium banfieldiae TaxID=1125847 RepID=L0NB33_9HYPH|nr:putative Cytochrome P450 [Pseudorhizobium banfieldiae]
MRGRSEADALPLEAPLDLLDPSFVCDPYTIYRRLRTHDPVHRSRNGGWILTRHRDIVSALGDPSLGNAPSRYSVVAPRNRGRYVCANVAQNILPFLDKPEHVRPRRILSRVLSTHMKDNPLDIAQIARQLLDPQLARRQMDAIADFGTPLSAEVMCRMLGIPAPDRDRMLEYSHYFFFLFAPIPSDQIRQKADEALTAFRGYFADLVQERRRKPQADLISLLLSAEDEGERLSDCQLVDNCMLLFSDGVENVDAGIANILLALGRHPAEMKRLRDAPELIANAVAEGLRYDSPAQLIARVARDDVEIGGQTIKRDSTVFLALGSANRDPAVFADPDRFNISRNTSPLLSFGKGGHSCIGASLVRSQSVEAVRSLLQTTTVVEVDQDGLEWLPRVGHRWLKTLPIRLFPS